MTVRVSGALTAPVRTAQLAASRAISNTSVSILPILVGSKSARDKLTDVDASIAFGTRSVAATRAAPMIGTRSMNLRCLPEKEISG
jgi:hypothetical protein